MPFEAAHRYDRVIRSLREKPEDYLRAFLQIDASYRALLLFTYQSWLWNEGVRRLLQLVLPRTALFPLRYQAGTLLFHQDGDPETLRGLRGLTFPLLGPDTPLGEIRASARRWSGCWARRSSGSTRCAFRGPSASCTSSTRSATSSCTRKARPRAHPAGRAEPRVRQAERGVHLPPGQLRDPGGEAAVPPDGEGGHARGDPGQRQEQPARRARGGNEVSGNEVSVSGNEVSETSSRPGGRRPSAGCVEVGARPDPGSRPPIRPAPEPRTGENEVSETWSGVPGARKGPKRGEGGRPGASEAAVESRASGRGRPVPDHAAQSSRAGAMAQRVRAYELT